ncbi:eukaryotic translation initiation factor 3 subunit G-domain-containing protein [Peziza echinospora]|nr:eukaryotic translation initiation factor 3 subunit G-domain-containing protein [Peziza echinospora]
MPAVERAATDWADDDDLDELPAQQILTNNDGTKTIITYRFEDGKKIKTTRRIRTTVVKEHVNPRVAERKEWSKFGKEKGHPKGPDVSTTTIGENMLFKPNVNYKVNQKEETGGETQNMKDKLKDKKVACRICKGDHFTARCPYKDTLPPMDEVTANAGADDMGGNDTANLGDGEGGTRYIAPHLRKGAGDKAGDKLGGSGGGSGNFRDRDDLATLRVTNISDMCEEQDLWNMFERFGKVIRVFLAKDRETGRSKGFAFISYTEQSDAAKACEKMDGHGFGHLILRVEFAKRA